jgi:hypothetical protein
VGRATPDASDGHRGSTADREAKRVRRRRWRTSAVVTGLAALVGIALAFMI